MPEIRIPEGETVEIVPEMDTGGEYAIRHVEGGPVSLDHNPRDVTATPARTLTSGDEGTINQFSGSSVWAYADGRGATLRVTQVGFSLTLFSNKTVERPADEATRENRVVNDFVTGNAPLNGAYTGNPETVFAADGPRAIEMVTLQADNWVEDLWVQFLLGDPSSPNAAFSANLPQFPIYLDPARYVADGNELQVQVFGGSTGTDFRLDALHRDVK